MKVWLTPGDTKTTITWYCGEAEAWQGALDAIKGETSRLVEVDLTKNVKEEDKIYGGIIDVFIDIFKWRRS